MIRTVYLGKLAQSGQYKGINSLCFACGRIGHKLELCPYIIKEQSNEPITEQSASSKEHKNAQRMDKTRVERKQKEEYGEWMVVSRRKPNNKVPNNKVRNKQHILE